jgi:hypothetical protein
VLAAEIIDGRIALMKLTAKTVAAIVGVSQSSVNAALRYPPGNGQQSLPAIARWCSGDRDRYRRRSTGGGSTMMRCWLPSTSSSSRL